MTNTYSPIVKTLKNVEATIRPTDNIVTHLTIEVEYAFMGDTDLPAWQIVYVHSEDVEDLGKTQDQFSKSELIGMFPSVYDDEIFHIHYENANFPNSQAAESLDINALEE